MKFLEESNFSRTVTVSFEWSELIALAFGNSILTTDRMFCFYNQKDETLNVVSKWDPIPVLAEGGIEVKNLLNRGRFVDKIGEILDDDERIVSIDSFECDDGHNFEFKITVSK